MGEQGSHVMSRRTNGRIQWNSHLCLFPLLVGRTEALRVSSLTGRDLTRRTRGTASRRRLTGTTRGTGDTLPRYSNNLRTRETRTVRRQTTGRTEGKRREGEETEKEKQQGRRGSRRRKQRRHDAEVLATRPQSQFAVCSLSSHIFGWLDEGCGFCKVLINTSSTCISKC